VRYWRLYLKKTKGVIVSNAAIRKLQQEAEIPQHSTLLTPGVVTRLREAAATLREYQSQHHELRQNHLEALAEARASSINPALLGDPDRLERATDKDIRRIQRNEYISRSHRKVQNTLHPNSAQAGLSAIDIPFAQKEETQIDPKQWAGSWTTITDPQEIATKICSANSAQYHQATDTPFASEPLRSYFGLNGDGPGVQQILASVPPPPHIMDNLLPETQALLRTLANIPIASSIDTSITTAKFRQLNNILPEKISSSPSGRHIGHYKAIAKSEKLTNIWATMMALPHLAGFSPKRWREVVDVMLQKTPGNSKIHRLRIVALQESDFNQSNCLAIGRPVMHHLEDSQLIPKIQFGSRPARLCISAVLNKQRQFEIQRYKKHPIAYIENDATRCYDRIVNPLVLIKGN
jgi:hypothetical protein